MRAGRPDSTEPLPAQSSIHPHARGPTLVPPQYALPRVDSPATARADIRVLYRQDLIHPSHPQSRELPPNPTSRLPSSHVSSAYTRTDFDDLHVDRLIDRFTHNHASRSTEPVKHRELFSIHPHSREQPMCAMMRVNDWHVSPAFAQADPLPVRHRCKSFRVTRKRASWPSTAEPPIFDG